MSTEQPKLSKEKKKQMERDTEAKMAKEMPWDNIYAEISQRKTSRDVIVEDIEVLDKKRAGIEAEIRHYQRIAGFKRKQAGA